MRRAHSHAFALSARFRQAYECAEEDWAADSRDGLTMPRELFMDALFQIADLYTDTASAVDYAAFLRRVLERCIPKGVSSDEAVFWKSKMKKSKAPPPQTPEPSSEAQESPKLHLPENHHFLQEPFGIDLPRSPCGEPPPLQTSWHKGL